MRRETGPRGAARQRAARLRELQRQVAAGTYRVPALVVADAILARHLPGPKD